MVRRLLVSSGFVLSVDAGVVAVPSAAHADTYSAPL